MSRRINIARTMASGLLLMVLALASSCADRGTGPETPPTTNHFVDPDSVNIAVLVLRAAPFQVLGGTVLRFAPCQPCSTADMPVSMGLDARGDIVQVNFSYLEAGDVFSGLQVWAGRGFITYPEAFELPSSLGRSETALEKPSQSLWRSYGAAFDTAVTDSIWRAVNFLAVTGEFASPGLRLGYYFYSPGYDDDPAFDRGILFLYRGNQ
jgi:hypothetical protein